jgi:hypothetical protein
VYAVMDIGHYKYAIGFTLISIGFSEALRRFNLYAAKYALMVRNDLWEMLFAKMCTSNHEDPGSSLALILIDAQKVRGTGLPWRVLRSLFPPPPYLSPPPPPPEPPFTFSKHLYITYNRFTTPPCFSTTCGRVPSRPSPSAPS